MRELDNEEGYWVPFEQFNGRHSRSGLPKKEYYKTRSSLLEFNDALANVMRIVIIVGLPYIWFNLLDPSNPRIVTASEHSASQTEVANFNNWFDGGIGQKADEAICGIARGKSKYQKDETLLLKDFPECDPTHELPTSTPLLQLPRRPITIVPDPTSTPFHK